MMVIVFLLVAFLGVSIAQNVADLGILQLQFYSTSPSDADNTLDETIRITTDFLDAYFAQNFEQTVGEKYFSHVELAVVTFDILSGSAVSIDLVGSVSFQTLPIPGETFLTSLLSDAFTGDARLEYVNALQTATIPFLRDISYVVIGMNNNLIANEDVAALGNAQNDSTKKVARKHLTIAEIAIIAGTSAGFVAVVIISSLLIMMSREGKKNQETNTTDKMRGRDMVVVTRTHSKGSSNTEIDVGASRSVSPLRSVLSQDSSVFTYNPGSTTNSKKAPSTFSNDHSDGSMALDVEAWAQVSIASPADIDISAIELDKKDLSLIQEGDNEEESPRKKQRSGRSKERGKDTKSNYLSKEVLVRRDLSPLQYSKVSSKKKSKQRFMNDSWYSEDDTASHYSDGSDVIDDLNNLSRQVNKHRGSYH